MGHVTFAGGGTVYRSTEDSGFRCGAGDGRRRAHGDGADRCRPAHRHNSVHESGAGDRRSQPDGHPVRRVCAGRDPVRIPWRIPASRRTGPFDPEAARKIRDEEPRGLARTTRRSAARSRPSSPGLWRRTRRAAISRASTSRPTSGATFAGRRSKPSATARVYVLKKTLGAQQAGHRGRVGSCRDRDGVGCRARHPLSQADPGQRSRAAGANRGRGQCREGTATSSGFGSGHGLPATHSVLG